MRSPRIRSLTPLATVSTSGSSGIEPYFRRESGLWFVGALGFEAGKDGLAFTAKEESRAVDAEAGGVTESFDEGLFAWHDVTGAGHHSAGYLCEAERRAVKFVRTHKAVAAAGPGDAFGVRGELEVDLGAA